MDNLLKKALIGIIIVTKPPVFLTVSILVVIGYLTFVVLTSIIHEITSFVVSKQNGDPTLILLVFVSAFGVCWCLFFYSLAKYEIENELTYFLRVFQSSRRGLRCLPVSLIHLLGAFTFEYLIYTTVTNSIAKEKLNGLIESSPKHGLHNDKFNVIFTYTVWICSIMYSFFYFLSEELAILFSGENSMVELIHVSFVNLIFRTLGIDLSDLPNGESILNPALARLMEAMARNQEHFVPPSRAEYNSVRRRQFVIEDLLKRSADRSKNRKHLSWNTLR